MTASPEAIEALKLRLRTVELDGTTYWLAEGDLLLDEARLERYADGGAANVPRPDVIQKDELLGMTREGKMLRWRPGKILTYSIAKAEFSAGEYDTVNAEMRQATADWQDTCGIQFAHLIELDDTGAAGALFTVRKVDTGGKFLALAFFPDDPPERRKVVIDPTFFTTKKFSRAGILRHELGHVLGFRHEHIRSEAPAICDNEPLADTVELSNYDPQSVMHYFCGGMGKPTLEISDLDRDASQRLYGPPIATLEYCD